MMSPEDFGPLETALFCLIALIAGLALNFTLAELGMDRQSIVRRLYGYRDREHRRSRDDREES
jgi:hypothetical protein